MTKNESNTVFRLVCAFDKLINKEKSYLDECFVYNEILGQMVYSGGLGFLLNFMIKSEYHKDRKKLIKLFSSEIDVLDKAMSESTVYIAVECSELEVLEHLDLILERSDGSVKKLLLSQDAEIEGDVSFPRDDYRATFPDFFASSVMRMEASYLDWITANKLEAMDDETFSTVRRF